MIHALPGMGTDQRMFPEPWSNIPSFVAHDWMPHSGEKKLADVAQVMCKVCGIRDGDVLIGCSLGGMVACEITKIRKISTLYLVGSATDKEEISNLLAFLHPLIKIAPIDWLRFLASKIPHELTQMFSGAETSFIRTMCFAIFQWEGLDIKTTRIYRIHGKHDLIIPPPNKVDLLLNGGHLISMSHAIQCVEFIQSTLN